MEKKELNEARIVSSTPKYTGYESNVFEYLDDDGEIVLFKRFKEHKYWRDTEETARNKEQKLEIITSLKDSSLVTVKQGLFKNGILVGYTMPEVTGERLCFGSKRKNKIKTLEKVKDIMLRLNKHGIYICDHHFGTYVIGENGKVTCLDIDNYRVFNKDAHLDCDAKPIYVVDFENECSKSKKVDRYCYNIFVYTTMGNIRHIIYPEELNGELPKGLDTKHNKTVIKEMLTLGKDYKGHLLEFKKKN